MVRGLNSSQCNRQHSVQRQERCITHPGQALGICISSAVPLNIYIEPRDASK